MKTLDIVLGVIQQGEHYVLQLRGDDPKIGGAGKIGCFGGKIEPNESPVEAVCRELSEETNLQPQKDQITLLGNVDVISDHRLEPVKVHAHVFHIPIHEETIVEAFEGMLVKMHLQEAIESLHKMTTGTRACFEQLLIKE